MKSNLHTNLLIKPIFLLNQSRSLTKKNSDEFINKKQGSKSKQTKNNNKINCVLPDSVLNSKNQTASPNLKQFSFDVQLLPSSSINTSSLNPILGHFDNNRNVSTSEIMLSVAQLRTSNMVQMLNFYNQLLNSNVKDRIESLKGLFNLKNSQAAAITMLKASITQGELHSIEQSMIVDGQTKIDDACSSLKGPANDLNNAAKEQTSAAADQLDASRALKNAEADETKKSQAATEANEALTKANLNLQKAEKSGTPADKAQAKSDYNKAVKTNKQKDDDYKNAKEAVSNAKDDLTTKQEYLSKKTELLQKCHSEFDKECKNALLNVFKANAYEIAPAQNPDLNIYDLIKASEGTGADFNNEKTKKSLDDSIVAINKLLSKILPQNTITKYLNDAKVYVENNKDTVVDSKWLSLANNLISNDTAKIQQGISAISENNNVSNRNDKELQMPIALQNALLVEPISVKDAEGGNSSFSQNTNTHMNRANLSARSKESAVEGLNPNLNTTERILSKNYDVSKINASNENSIVSKINASNENSIVSKINASNEIKILYNVLLNEEPLKEFIEIPTLENNFTVKVSKDNSLSSRPASQNSIDTGIKTDAREFYSRVISPDSQNQDIYISKTDKIGSEYSNFAENNSKNNTSIINSNQLELQAANFGDSPRNETTATILSATIQAATHPKKNSSKIENANVTISDIKPVTSATSIEKTHLLYKSKPYGQNADSNLDDENSSDESD